MAKANVQTPSGFPEFGPAAEQKRLEWIRVISDTFAQFGFTPITTPLVERLDNLLEKGGDTKEMYALKRVLDEGGDDHSGNALRFDHTVPLALYVARHFNEITFPFKRSAIGPVLRGERAQKGRFRQFDQCDIDIIGSENLDIKNDALVVAVIVEIFKKLGIGDFRVRINDRRLFNLVSSEQITVNSIINVVDDLEKIGEEKVREALSELGLSTDEVQKVMDFVSLKGTPNEVLKALEAMNGNEIFVSGVKDLKAVIASLEAMNVDKSCYEIDLSVARGLDYYTGTIYETTLTDHSEFGSICSGGRYDDLAAVFTGKKLPGVGISIGLTRLFSQCLEAGIVKPDRASVTDFLLVAADEVAQPKLLELGTELRKIGIKAENYLENKKLKKQLDYADKQKIPFVVVMGERELEDGVVQVKDMINGGHKTLKTEELVQFFTPQ